MRISHIGWNLAGLSLPLLVAAATVPELLNKIGNERFGFLALAWGLIGYAGALDLGMGRSLTLLVARLRGNGDLGMVPSVLVTASRISFVGGAIGGGAIALAAFSGAGEWIDTQYIQPSEIRNAILLLAIALPMQAMSAAYRGLSEAFMNFRGVSVLRVGLGVINFGGPYILAHHTENLFWLIAPLTASRVLALLVLRSLAYSCLSEKMVVLSEARYCGETAKSLMSFGGWVTVSSVISPVLVQADRFFIGVMLSAGAVTTYVLPYELVVQSLILVGAVSSVIFPVLSRVVCEQPGDWLPYFRRWVYIVATMMLIVCCVTVLLLPLVFEVWLQNDIEPESITVGRILCLGVFLNSIGAMYFALLHAKGRADFTAKLHLIELPFFITILTVLVGQYGVVGAAWAWVARMAFDTCALVWGANKSNA